MPPKSPGVCLVLKDLADILFKEFKSKEKDHNLNAVITLGQTALEFTSPERPRCQSVLIGLAGLLSERFSEPQRQTILLELDDHLFECFKCEDSMVDLEDIISLSRAALERTCPLDRCRPLVNLANALHEQFQKQDTENSIAKAVSLFGVSQVHLPIFYSESAQNAHGHLLAKIISRSGDVSVLDWTVIRLQLILSDLARRMDLNQAQKLYITAVKLQGLWPSSSRYRYEIQASRLRPLNVALSVELDESVDSYILVRLWHPKSLGQQMNHDVEALWKPLDQLKQPFNALLLKRLFHNEYTRIACDCMIAARVRDLPSMESEVLIPEIV
ncbi:hypothetical protein EDD17DRAFT_1834636 [Pisolithus thermaeus]|nr:hypothetical protein EV401DRAFT_2074509 [Pisolithus croceorrhizus]KAI6160161.1 hypothetical protein EDD17DRAFT_1834636 [Pisolithus thermaeus]